MIRSVLVASALIVASFPQAPTPASGEQLPTFRTGVDIVELDVTVLDKDRHPVKGLTADDFIILDRGKPQSIVAFSTVDVPTPVSYPAPWMREAPLDVVSNVENRRLVTIVMDDAYTEFNPDFGKRAKQIAKNAVEELGPADLAAVVFTFMGRPQNFTSDRSRLLAAIDSYVPRQRNGEPPLPCWGPSQSARGIAPRLSGSGTVKCDTEKLATVAETLSTASPGRKVVMWSNERLVATPGSAGAGSGIRSNRMQGGVFRPRPCIMLVLRHRQAGHRRVGVVREADAVDAVG